MECLAWSAGQETGQTRWPHAKRESKFPESSRLAGSRFEPAFLFSQPPQLLFPERETYVKVMRDSQSYHDLIFVSRSRMHRFGTTASSTGAALNMVGPGLFFRLIYGKVHPNTITGRSNLRRAKQSSNRSKGRRLPLRKHPPHNCAALVSKACATNSVMAEFRYFI